MLASQAFRDEVNKLIGIKFSHRRRRPLQSFPPATNADDADEEQASDCTRKRVIVAIPKAAESVSSLLPPLKEKVPASKSRTDSAFGTVALNRKAVPLLVADLDDERAEGVYAEWEIFPWQGADLSWSDEAAALRDFSLTQQRLRDLQQRRNEVEEKREQAGGIV
ncbi:hypothetical protein BDK51DRAFT_53181 [Blyttiomyces helicus]|uniref:Uncharacterized protein n=1 Tax=Blyttiomyces helicus TaxID=388810 RepID=A0A4V1IQV8_9FUNG|nr:hypothetical protein BDK51DRAFT_53181 [Blyttiomyces helicus]|eukprot:RKO87907.1 hypothetical protein BDK51DRAFT_53181 [Blyttiomyces helicus]